MNKIKVIDSIMGSFKTTTAINKMKVQDDKNYIFITPYLDEIERIKKELKDYRRFYDPVNKGKGKLDNLHKLLTNEKDIATTHALFKGFNNTTIELLKAGNYILILDEVVDVVEKINISKSDLNIILDKLAHIDDEGFLIWDDAEYTGKFSHIKQMADNKNVIMHNNVLLFWLFPVEVFKAFKDIYILTYLFKAQIQKYYYDMYNLEYEYYIPDCFSNDFILKPNNHTDKDIKKQLKDKIHIIDDKINNIGDDYYSLSKSWYDNKDNKALVKKVKNNTVNYFKRKLNSKSELNMWSCYKDHKSKLKGEGYTKGFVSCNARATNEYRHKENLAYLINRFMNPIIKEFFTSKNIEVNEEQFALSELIQWVWRSQIRDDKPINIYIPSFRMRTILVHWLDDK